MAALRNATDIVGRLVVDHHDLERGILLVDDREQRDTEEVRLVVAWNDDGDEGPKRFGNDSGSTLLAVRADTGSTPRHAAIACLPT